MKRVIPTLFALLALFALAACTRTRPWEKYPSATPPDQSCQTGVEAGDVIYVWTCRDGKHVVIHQFGNYFGGGEPVREVAACGEKTPYEQEQMGPGFVCNPGLKWVAAPTGQ